MIPSMSTAVLAREAAISVVINGVLSALFYLLLYHGLDAVPVWGIGNFVLDFVPQTFMIALMGTMVPGFIASRASRTRTAIVRPALRFTLVTLIACVLSTMAVLWATRVEVVSFGTGLMVKILYGASLAAVVTPSFLRSLSR